MDVILILLEWPGTGDMFEAPSLLDIKVSNIFHVLN
jgi:hypothetical protein